MHTRRTARPARPGSVRVGALSSTAAALAGAALTLIAAAAHAGECAAPTGAAAALGERDPAERLRFLRESLQATAKQERRFILGWTLTYTGFGAGSWVLVPVSDDPGKRIDAIWSSSTAAAGAILAVVQPLLVLRDVRQAEQLIAGAGAGAAGTGCQVLAEVERRLERAALNEAGARSAFSHISSAAINVALGLVLAYGLKRPSSAAMNTTIGLLISEVMIVTRPTEAVSRLERYRAGDLTAPPPSRISLAPAVAPLGADQGRGALLSLAGTF